MLPDKLLQEGKEISFLTYCSEGQANWFDRSHSTASTRWVPQVAVLTAEGWGNTGMPQGLGGRTSPHSERQVSSLRTWWQWAGTLLRPLQGGLGCPADCRGEVALGQGSLWLVGRTVSFICFDGKAIVECGTCRPGWQNTQPVYSHFSMNFNGNCHNFSFHTGARWSFCYNSKDFFSHQ